MNITHNGHTYHVANTYELWMFIIRFDLRSEFQVQA